MNSKLIAKLVLAGAVVGLPAIGGASNSVSQEQSAQQELLKKANGWARKAEKEFGAGKIDKALELAENAVQADMENREYRALLSRIYMAQGRFVSAERTLQDVMDMGGADSRTIVSLALSQIAQGKADSAVALVDENRDILPASDYGLALALAGKSSRAVDILVEAIRADNADARTRQNLALAYALDGRWRESRIMATQDMPETQVNDRIAEWAQYARPGAYETRIAGLLKVTPVATDSGQPVRLALAHSASQMALATNSGVRVAAVAPENNEELAAVGPAPTSNSQGFAAAESHNMVAMNPAPQKPQIVYVSNVIKAQLGPIKTAFGNVSPKKPAVAKPVKLALADVEPAAASPRKASGSHLVQLGAFSSAANAQHAWDLLTKKHGILAGHQSASSTVTIQGKKLIRLAAMGFNNLASAQSVCNSIKSGGGACIVRSLDGDPKPAVRMAFAKAKPKAAAQVAAVKPKAHSTTQIASR